MAALSPNLALILFLPWFALLGALYWYYPRNLPETAARRRFDVLALVLAIVLSFIAMRLGFAIASDSIEAGPIWKQVLATLLAYKAFLLVLALAWFRRRQCFGSEAR